MNRSFTSLIWLFVLASCTTSGPSGLFGKKSSHEVYAAKLKTAGLHETALGRQWFQAAEEGLYKPLLVKLPYKEKGYFKAEQPRAAGIRFNARRGEMINISVTKKPETGFLLFLDLWQESEAGESTPRLVLSADTTEATLQYEVKKEGVHVVRLQPELLKNGEYTLTVATGPSLTFPVSPTARANIGSFWGADRDGGARRHEGVDIFAPMRTELVAAGDGTIGAVNETGIGGKVIWLRPQGKDYSLYYAHLDEQLVTPGERVRAGQVIGLMGKTGNAKTTSPHLHFGIYAVGGAVDPLPFINNKTKQPPAITVSTDRIGDQMKTTKQVQIQPINNGQQSNRLQPNTLLLVEAASENNYKVRLPDGSTGYVAGSALSGLAKPIKQVKLKQPLALLDQPATDGLQKALLQPGDQVDVLASYSDYFFVSYNKEEGWLPRQAL